MHSLIIRRDNVNKTSSHTSVLRRRLNNNGDITVYNLNSSARKKCLGTQNNHNKRNIYSEKKDFRRNSNRIKFRGSHRRFRKILCLHPVFIMCDFQSNVYPLLFSCIHAFMYTSHKTKESS